MVCMEGIAITLYAEVSSFRNPGGQLYHSCLPLPPFSTLVGLAGAARGVAFSEAIEFFQENKIFIGVTGRAKGLGKDLWSYTKIISKETKKDIVVREFLASLDVEIFYACEIDSIIDELKLAFSNPCYALSLGNNDEIIKIKKISKYSDVEKIKTNKVENTVIATNIANQYIVDWDKIKQSPISLTLKAPLIQKLPVKYEFNRDNGSRKGIQYETFSFIDSFINFKEEITAYRFGDKEVPLYYF